MAQNLFKFENEADYRTAKRNHLIVPNVCYIKDSGKTYINGTTASKNEAEAGDIITFDTDGEMMFIKPEAYSLMSGTFTPVAVTVIPASHTIDNKVVGVSLKAMSDATPTTGSTFTQGIVWGENLGMAETQYSTVVSLDINDLTSPNRTLTAVEISHLPSDAFFDYRGASKNIVDTYTKWRENFASYTPSPYAKNGSTFSPYFTTEITNALSEIDGVTNSEFLNDVANPAINLCRRYNVLIYKTAGNWYLPSLCELGYMMVRFDRIAYALDVINSKSLGGAARLQGGTYWSSTLGTDNKAWCLATNTGQIGKDDISSALYVRAFARF